MTTYRYNYDSDTLRGMLARVVQSRAQTVIEDVAADDGDTANVVVTVTDAARVMDGDDRNYDRLLEDMDVYLDDWASAVVENLGFVR